MSTLYFWTIWCYFNGQKICFSFKNKYISKWPQTFEWYCIYIKLHWSFNVYRLKLSIPNIYRTNTPFCPQPQFVRARTLHGVESVPQGCWPMLTPILPTVVSGCLNVFGWWTILDTHRKLLSVKNPTAFWFLTQTRAPGTYCPTLFKGTYMFCLAHLPSEWHTIHDSIVSRLKKTYLTCLLPFIYVDCSVFNKWRQWGIITFPWIHLVSPCHGKSRCS
jgi:hypothetical protein